jgi:WD40 repeat protein/serine/threonine protein kinase
MNNPSSDPDPLLPLAEEFAERYRRGEHPSLTEYAEKHPELAERIRRLFPTLAVIEEFGSVAGEPTGPFAVVAGSVPQRLGEYRLLREVGRGGMGIVYEAVQESLGRHVALKVLTSPGLLSPTQLQRFEREARAAARLHHTNIVPVYGVGEADGVHYYAMQFIQGRSADGVLQELRRLRQVPASPAGEPTTTVTPSDAEHKPDTPAKDAPSSAATPSSGVSELSGRSDAEYFRSVARVGVQAAEALAHAHAQGVVHRDIKPANLLIDTQGAVWIADFGLAKLEGSDDLTGEGEVPGTLRYMAPERFTGQADARSDLYSLGLTLYEMLTLRPAFSGGDRAALVKQILHTEPPRPRALDPPLPRDLETIVLKCIAKEPGQRYPSADALADDLRHFLAGEPVRARPVGLGGRLLRWSKRNPALAGSTVAAAFATITALLIFAVGFFLVKDARDQAREKADKNEKLANERDNEQKKAKHEAAEADSERKKAQHDAAVADFERSYGQLEQDHARGLLWLARSLRVAKENNAPDVEWSIRALLAGWSRDVHPLRAVAQLDGAVIAVSFDQPMVPRGRSGAWLVTARPDHSARVWTAEGQSISAPLRHAGPVRAAAFSEDAKTVITAGDDGAARLWDLQGKSLGKPLMPPVISSPREVASLAANGSPWVAAAVLAPPRPLVAAALTPDGKMALAGREDGTLWRWELPSGKLLGGPMTHPGKLTRFALSPFGEILLAGGGSVNTLWATHTGTLMGTLKGGPAPLGFSGRESLSLTMHGRELGEFGTAQVGDAMQKIPWLRRPMVPLRFQGEFDETGTSRRDELGLITGGRYGLVQLWDIEEENPFSAPMMHTSAVTAVACGRRVPGLQLVLAGCADGTAQLWDPMSARQLGAPLRHQGPITAVALRVDPKTRDMKTMLTASLGGTVRVWECAHWNSKTPDDPNLVGSTYMPTAVYSPDGKTIALVDNDGRRTRTLGSGPPSTTPFRGAQLRHPGDKVLAVAFSPDSKVVLTGGADRTARLWESVQGKSVGEPLLHFVAVRAAAWSADGRVLATGGYDAAGDRSEVRFWDGATREPLGAPLAAGRVNALALSPDGTMLVTGDTQGFVRRWDFATRQQRGEPSRHWGRITCLVFSPDGKKFLAADADRTARIWDASTGKPLGLPMSHEAAVTSAAFTPDSKIVLTGSLDRGARVWEAATAKPLGPPLWRSAMVLAVAFDGSSILTQTAGSIMYTPELRQDVRLTVAGDPERIELWVQVLTGMELDEGGFARTLDADTWQARRKRLAELGGPP